MRRELVPRFRVPRLALRRVEERLVSVIDRAEQEQRLDRERVERMRIVERRTRRRQVAATERREERVDAAARVPRRKQRVEDGERANTRGCARQKPPRPRLVRRRAPSDDSRREEERRLGRYEAPV